MRIRRYKKILVVRTDRLGDVILSTPVLEALKKENPDLEIDFLVQKNVAPLFEGHPYLNRVISIGDPEKMKYREFFALRKQIKSAQYDAALMLQVNAKIAFLISISGIPERSGPLSKWYSYLFLNRGVRQHRSLCEMHETDYNLMLLRRWGVKFHIHQYKPLITVPSSPQEKIDAYLLEKKLSAFVVIHPGMGGSALNVGRETYLELTKKITDQGIAVVIGSGPAELTLAESIRVDSCSFLVHVFQGTLVEYAALIARARCMVAPSTGPLHLAVALGVSTISVYPPIRVQSAVRWGPYDRGVGLLTHMAGHESLTWAPSDGSSETKHDVFVPDVYCGQDFHCAGSKCPFYYCMDRIYADDLAARVLSHMGESLNVPKS